MEEPLGRTVGNALETVEAFDVLHGRGPADLTECTLALGAEMLVMGAVARSVEEGRAKLEASVRDGSALAVARKMVAGQGGDARVVDEPDRLPSARGRHAVRAAPSGARTRRR